jgi:hypothetical protein
LYGSHEEFDSGYIYWAIGLLASRAGSRLEISAQSKSRSKWLSQTCSLGTLPVIKRQGVYKVGFTRLGLQGWVYKVGFTRLGLQSWVYKGGKIFTAMIFVKILFYKSSQINSRISSRSAGQ